MGKYTWGQIHKALNQAIKDDWHQSELLKSIAEAPFYKTIIKITFTCEVQFAEDDDKYLEIPLHIMVEDANITKAILMEVTSQIFQHGDITFYDEKPCIEFKEIRIYIHEVYSTETDKYAIFHQEQECGCSWLVVTKDDLIAPITYQKGNKLLQRTETNRVHSQYINRKKSR